MIIPVAVPFAWISQDETPVIANDTESASTVSSPGSFQPWSDRTSVMTHAAES